MSRLRQIGLGSGIPGLFPMELTIESDRKFKADSVGP